MNLMYGFGEYDEPPHLGKGDPMARHMSLWPEHRLCAIAPLWPLSDPTHPSPVVRHCSKNPIPGKTGIKTKIQELVLRLMYAQERASTRNMRSLRRGRQSRHQSLRRGRQSRHPASGSSTRALSDRSLFTWGWGQIHTIGSSQTYAFPPSIERGNVRNIGSLWVRRAP